MRTATRTFARRIGWVALLLPVLLVMGAATAPSTQAAPADGPFVTIVKVCLGAPFSAQPESPDLFRATLVVKAANIGDAASDGNLWAFASQPGREDGLATSVPTVLPAGEKMRLKLRSDRLTLGRELTVVYHTATAGLFGCPRDDIHGAVCGSDLLMPARKRCFCIPSWFVQVSVLLTK